MTASQRAWLHALWLLGVLLATTGLGADCALALRILEGAGGEALLLHVPAVLTWLLGVWLLRQAALRSRPRSGPLSGPSGSPEVHVNWALNGWTTVAAAVALLPFPAVGPLGMTLALAMIWAFRLAPSHPASTHAIGGSQYDAVDAAHGSPLYELNVQPLVDIFESGAPELEQAAIQALVVNPSAHGVELLRGLLDGADPELRNAAALALFRIEAGFERILSRAEQAKDATPPAMLADLYLRYARSGLLDDVSSGMYLEQACSALQQALASATAPTDLLFQLAALQHDLGRTLAMQDTLEQALGDGRASVHGYLLGMGIAYGDGDWEQLLALARQACRVASADDEGTEIARWWAGAARGAGALADYSPAARRRIGDGYDPGHVWGEHDARGPGLGMVHRCAGEQGARGPGLGMVHPYDHEAQVRPREAVGSGA